MLSNFVGRIHAVLAKIHGLVHVTCKTETVNQEAIISTYQDSTPKAPKHYSSQPGIHINGTTAHPSVSYTPGSFSMEPMNQNWGHQFPANPYQPQPYSYQHGNQQQTPRFNSFAQTSNSQNTNSNLADNATAILDQMAKLFSNYKPSKHQVQEVQAITPSSGSWDLDHAAEVPQNHVEEFE